MLCRDLAVLEEMHLTLKPRFSAPVHPCHSEMLLVVLEHCWLPGNSHLCFLHREPRHGFGRGCLPQLQKAHTCQKLGFISKLLKPTNPSGILQQCLGRSAVGRRLPFPHLHSTQGQCSLRTHACLKEEKKYGWEGWERGEDGKDTLVKGLYLSRVHSRWSWLCPRGSFIPGL